MQVMDDPAGLVETAAWPDPLSRLPRIRPRLPLQEKPGTHPQQAVSGHVHARDETPTLHGHLPPDPALL